MPVCVHEDDDNQCRLELALASEADTAAFGAALAGALETGLMIHLEGDLGAGKTTLVRAALRALDFAGSVKSPTYTLIEPYAISRLNLYHFDFYRFTDPDEFLEAGLDEYFDGDGVCIVEWPDRAAPHLPPADVRILIRFEGTGRKVEARGLSPRGQECLRKIRKIVKP